MSNPDEDEFGRPNDISFLELHKKISLANTITMTEKTLVGFIDEYKNINDENP